MVFNRLTNACILIVADPAPTTNLSNTASSTLRCENLPAEVTDDVLGVLFQQYVIGIQSSSELLSWLILIQYGRNPDHCPRRYPGFQSTHVSPVLAANKSKTANVRYEHVDQATTAKDALDGFKLKKGWLMKVSYA